MKKHVIIGIIIGMSIAITSGSVWFLFRQNERITQNEAAIIQIVNFINANIETWKTAIE